ncbi:MAG: PASTA domain-containing protein [Sciscionella sp.]
MARYRHVTEVPDVVGLGAGDACAVVRAAGLVPYGPDFAEAPETGVVAAQLPVSTAGAEQGTPVFLWTQGGGSGADVMPTPPVEVGELEPA